MSGDYLPFGVFTTDEGLLVRSWDQWMAAATGIEAAEALRRPLVELFPAIRSRGLLATLESVLTRGTVEVLAPALHHYLFACAPAAPSAVFEHMQQHVTIAPLRDDARTVGLIVTIEDVTARVEGERQLLDKLHSGPSPESSRRPAEDSSCQEIESLTRLLGEQDWRVRRVAVTSLAQHGHAIVDSLVRTLHKQHDNLSVLSSALDLLATSDIDVVEPVIRFLDDDDANLRTQAALVLGERRDRRAVPALLAHLIDPDVNVTFHVIEALGRLQAAEASERLTEIAEQRDFFLAFPAIQALSRLGNAAVAPRLVPLLADDLLRAPVIEALGELGDEDAIPPLVRLLNTGETPAEVIAEALAGLHQRYETRHGAGDHIADLVRRTLTATGMQQILDAVHRVGPERLPALAKVLGWLDGEAVRRALTRLLGDPTVRAQVVEALVRNGPGVVLLLMEQLRAEDLETRQAAAVALGRIGDRRATAALVDALGDPETKVEAAGALARIGDRLAFDALMDHLGDPDAAARQATIAALNSIGHPEMRFGIAALLENPDPVLRESAVKIAGYFGYPECLDQVVACCRDESENVRRSAVEQLAFFDGPVAAPLLAALQDESPSVRAAAARSLVHFAHPSRAEVLIRALADPDPWVRSLSLRSLAAIGAAEAMPAVVERLQQDPAPLVRLAAIEAVARLSPAEAFETLEPLTDSANDDIARAAISALGYVTQPEALLALERHARGADTSRRVATIEALALRDEPRTSEVLQWVAAVDNEADVVNSALAALTRVGAREGAQGSAATRALIELSGEPGRRQAAITALSNLPPRRIEDIRKGLQHSSSDVRAATVEALSRMKHHDASTAVESALDDSAAPVRLTAVIELRYLGRRASQRKLVMLAKSDPDPHVRAAALTAISHAGGRDESGPVDPL